MPFYVRTDPSVKCSQDVNRWSFSVDAILCQNCKHSKDVNRGKLQILET
jgi:hypothetical protein